MPISDERAAARALFERGRFDEAQAALLRIVERRPDDLEALTDLGSILVRRGYRDAAQSCYQRAVGLAPDRAVLHLNLANVQFALGRYEEARAGYAAALARDPALAEAHQGLNYALTRLGREEEARTHRRLGFAGRAVHTASYRGTARPIDVLLLVSAAGGTFYTDEILDDRLFRVTTLVVDAYAGERIPPADVVLCALADADRCAGELAAAEALVARLDAPVVNAPARVRVTTRLANAARLGRLPGVVTARTEQFARAALVAADGPAELAARGFSFPLLLRAPGFHTGEHFVRVDAPDELRAAAAALPGDQTLVLAFLDLRDARGVVRKYRTMFVDGALYPLHLALSDQWKVHYFTAGMAGDAERRAEEARFLADPAAALGADALAALERVGATLGLDYAGVDFALDRDGAVVVFEANATMIVVPPGADPIWEYRRPAVARVIAAAQTMLRAYAGR